MPNWGCITNDLRLHLPFPTDLRKEVSDLYYREGVITCLLLALAVGAALWSRAVTFTHQLMTLGYVAFFLVMAVVFAIPKYKTVRVTDDEMEE